MLPQSDRPDLNPGLNRVQIGRRYQICANTSTFNILMLLKTEQKSKFNDYTVTI